MVTKRSNPNTSGRPPGPAQNNPVTHSKNDRRYGRDGSKADFPHSSTGHQPATIARDPAGSVGIAHETPHFTPQKQTVGWQPNAPGKFVMPSHPGTGKVK